MKRFAVFDIDGTLIRWQLYHAIADRLVSLGFIAPVKFQAIKDARMVWKRRESSDSYRDYEKKLIELYEAILTEISVDQLEQAAQAVFEEYKDQVYTYTRGLIQDLKRRRYTLLAISGSQIEVVRLIADYYCFDDFVGTVYAHRGQKFTGGKTIGSLHKDRTLRRLVKKHGLDYAGSVGVGDGASDIVLLKMVEQPIAFNPESELFGYAKSHGWKIVAERKNVIYELQAENGRYLLA